jgi:hypothetical protein
VSEPEEPTDDPSSIEAYLNLIQHQFGIAERELKDGERLRVFISTPEARVEALRLEGAAPDLLVVHGARTTIIAAVGSAQVFIDRVPEPPEEARRYLGFRISD